MIRPLALTAVLCLAFLAGCKDTHESVATKMSDKMKEAVAALKDVKDEASSKAAAAKIKALGEEIKELEKKMAALPQPTEAEAKKLFETQMKASTEAEAQLLQEMARISTTPKLLTPELDQAMNGMK
jgi:predicted  nucleic acid-binding Zn-ribbon protein